LTPAKRGSSSQVCAAAVVLMSDSAACIV
jgi:hypothetical protein